jgi:hypothetical protein
MEHDDALLYFQGRGTRRSREGVDALTVAVRLRKYCPAAAGGPGGGVWDRPDADVRPGSHARGLLVVQTAREIDEVVGHRQRLDRPGVREVEAALHAEVAAHDHPVSTLTVGFPPAVRVTGVRVHLD